MMKPNDVVLNKLLNAKVIDKKDVVTAKKQNKAINLNKMVKELDIQDKTVIEIFTTEC